jgi:hypothetical protein
MNYRNLLISGGVLLITINLPVMPVLWAAVIPDPVYQLTWVSIWQMLRYVLFPAPGMQYQTTWYSLGALILLFGVAIAVRHWLVKKFA